MKKFLIPGLTILVVLSFLLAPLFIKVKLECKTQFGDCPTEINSKLSSLNSKSLFTARSGAIKILKKDFLVSNYSLQFKLPNILHVDLLIKKPEFALVNKSSGLTDLVDMNGQVLATDGATSLPEVIIDADLPHPGENVDANTLSALKIINGVFEMYQVQSGESDGSSLTVDLTGPVRVIFPLGENDPLVLLGALRLIYTRVTTGDLAGKYSQIDLRFKNPVLR